MLLLINHIHKSLLLHVNMCIPGDRCTNDSQPFLHSGHSQEIMAFINVMHIYEI